jgi:hypothetical protein
MINLLPSKKVTEVPVRSTLYLPVSNELNLHVFECCQGSVAGVHCLRPHANAYTCCCLLLSMKDETSLVKEFSVPLLSYA